MVNVKDMNAADLLAALAKGDAAALDFAKAALGNANLRIAKAAGPSESSREAAQRLLGDNLEALRQTVADVVAGLPAHGADGNPDTTGYKIQIEARAAARAGVGIDQPESGPVVEIVAIPTRTLSPKYIAALRKCGKMKGTEQEA
jgi:hypothetical protein